MPLTLEQIQEINRRCYVDCENVPQIAGAMNIDPATVEQVVMQVYVDDVAAQGWKSDEEITKAEYDQIRGRYQSGKGHRNTAHAIARDTRIKPETVLAIAHSRFSNVHTHPAPKAVKVKPEKAKAMRKLVPSDLDEIHKLERFGWPVADIAQKLDVPPEVIAFVNRCLKSRWPYGDILENVNAKWGAE
ncbi:hypothetical protein HUZ88_19130 [Citrobacter portucalensis]|uniref:hypothetical protein n=1 Tax=Citrobacter portucalensis TaxID=1639133 RepID=UPI001EF7A6F4|nr:hypothetical protein [Citrobacter portucalensis]ULK55020.1 hypothetical protein HUZ88_19130 [Citrobacter portucalensis]